MASLDHALEQMAAMDMPPLPSSGPKVSGRIVRYGPKKRAWYVLHEHRTKNGACVIGGAFGYWGKLDPTKIEVDWSGISEDERRRLESIQAAAEQAEAHKRAERAKFAANRAQQQWKAANRLGGSPYLQRKGVQPSQSLRFFDDGTVLVPMIRYDATPRLVGVQKISPAGEKRFNRGVAKEGAACRLGAAPKDGQTIILAEGLATALSIRMSLDSALPVFVTFDCGNILPVGRILRAQYPASPILICADDDYATEGNPGVRKATAAAAQLGNARVVVPTFNQRLPDSRWTDFNDLHQAEGLEVVASQIRAAIDSLNAGGPRSSVDQAEHSDSAAQEDPDDRGEGSSVEDIAHKQLKRTVDRLLDRYVLIRGTDTVWDGENRTIIKVANLRLAENRKSVNQWLEHPRRRTVLADRVVFDPTCSGDPATSVNLFDRIDLMQPSHDIGDCSKMLALLQHLCGEAGQDQAPLTEYVLKWCAYPLQHLGTKLHTALAFAGPEGAGKNMWFGFMLKMYGKYGGIITQSELESQYTSWRAAKLFVVANEVITRQEMRHKVGLIKNLITEDLLPIDEKYMPLRYEKNHMNLVFFSNELQPLFIGKGDRRFLVVRTPGPLPDHEYREIAAEAENGGLAALHHYLLNLDLGDFAPWTKPPMTDAKEQLIELGLSSAQAFAAEWKSGLLPLRCTAALREHVYQAYSRWCVINGERVPKSAIRFWAEVMEAMPEASVQRPEIPDPAQLDRPPAQRRVFVAGAPAQDAQKSEWLRREVSAFHDELEAYTGKS